MISVQKSTTIIKNILHPMIRHAGSDLRNGHDIVHGSLVQFYHCYAVNPAVKNGGAKKRTGSKSYHKNTFRRCRITQSDNNLVNKPQARAVAMFGSINKI